MTRRTSTAAPVFRLLAFVAFAWAGASAALAELAWPTRDFEGTLKPGQESLTTRFDFKNSGNTTVRVTEIRTGCGCTNGKADRSEYSPGQTGVISVDFAAKGATGIKEQTLHVITDEPGGAPYKLNLKIKIAEWLTVAPRLLLWPLNSPATPKTSRLTLDPSSGDQILRATSSDPAFTVRLLPPPAPANATPTEPASVTDLEITPTATDHPARAVISVVVRLPSAEELTKTVHVRVR